MLFSMGTILTTNTVVCFKFIIALVHVYTKTIGQSLMHYSIQLNTCQLKILFNKILLYTIYSMYISLNEYHTAIELSKRYLRKCFSMIYL